MAKILVVEDEAIIALGASMVLEDASHSVVMAPNGEAGLAEALASEPDLIVTDYMMPRMDGLTMIRALREHGKQTPVILATSIPEDGISGNLHRLYDAYLGKPYRDTALLETVNRLLDGGGPTEP